MRIKVGLALLLFAAPALAHEAPSGWRYSVACCDNKDCAPLVDGTVVKTETGWLWDGELFPFGSRKLQPSGDDHFHGCKVPELKESFPQDYRKCLYIPQIGGV